MSEIKILPKGSFVYAQLNRVEEGKSKGGIILPEKHSEGTRLARVIAVGPDVSKDVQVGNIYAVQWFAGTVINMPGNDMMDDTRRFINESELMGRIEEIDDGDA